jgi:hypothetical protein
MKALCAPLIAAAALVTFAAPASPGPFSADRPAQVVFLTKPASAVQGSAVRATVVVSRVVPRCSGALRHGRTTSTKVAPVVRLRASFTWQLPAAATPGVWSIAISCGLAGSTSGSLRVTKRQPPAIPPTVVADRSGFSVADSGGSRVMGYGIVLRNSTPGQDAIGVTVTVNVVDASNGVLKTDTTRIAAIAASTTYYFGGAVPLDASAAPANLQVNVQVEAGRPARLRLPPVSNLTATADSSGGAHVQGQLSNPYTKPMSSLTRITSVVFDAAGNVIGGGITFPAAPIPPGARVGFDMPIAGVTLDRIGSVQASAEPQA